MYSVGDVLNSEEVARFSGVKNSNGLQCGILVNDIDKVSVLIMGRKENNIASYYPNYWDEKTIGILHYCGTNKGLAKDIPKQSLDSKLNSAIYRRTYPIHVMVRNPDKTYLYLGIFERIPDMDKPIDYDNRIIYQFALVSRNIDKVESLIKELM